MAHARQYNRNAAEVNAGIHLDSDLDLLFAFDNAHDGSTTEHGATGAVVGTTNSQTLTNKTLTSPIIDGTTVMSGDMSTVSLHYEAFTADDTVADDSVICAVTTLGANITLTLSTAAITATAGRIWIFKDAVGTCGNAYTITIDTEGAETIDGQATYVMCSNYESVKLFSDKTNLFVIPD